MISKKCPTKEQLYNDVISTRTWSEIAKKYGYKSSRFLEKKAREWKLPDKIRKYKGFDMKNFSHHRIYMIWFDMKRRCNQKHNKSYDSYGGKGIKVCEEWLDFQKFFDWSMANGYDDKLSIDRIDFDGDYEPNNCRWADIYVQANNRTNNHFITYNGETMTMMQWSKRLNISYSTLRARLRYGMDVETAFTRPIGRWL